jgi:hypothetical protein
VVDAVQPPSKVLFDILASMNGVDASMSQQQFENFTARALLREV